jgi:hypothetical protein
MIALNRHAIGFAAEAVADYGIDPNYFDPVGKVNGAASPQADAHNRSYATHLGTLGEDFRDAGRSGDASADGVRPLRLGPLHAGHGDAATCGVYQGLGGWSSCERRDAP